MMRIAAAVLMVLATAAAAIAAPGDTVERAFPLGATLVPLPQGRWTVAADAPEMDGRISAVVLAQVQDKAVRGVIIARTNAEPLKTIFGSSAECDRTDTYLAYTAYDTPQDGLCGFANLVVGGGEGAAVWTAARTWLRQQGIEAGDIWLMVGLRARVRPTLLDVRYYFPPPDHERAAGWSASAWTPARLDAAPQRAAAIDQLRLWAAWMRNPVALGVRGRSDDIDLPPVPFGGTDILAALVAARMRALDALRDAGGIGPAEYGRQRAVLEQVQAAPDRADMPLWVRSAWKTLTYRVASIIDALGVSYLVLGSVTQTIGFSLIGELIRPPAVYLHEMAWARSGIGRPAAPARPQEFAEIGADR
ncbi:MAG: DUF2061 domain-containing protein [Acetobacteraceae bacterium]